MGNGRNLKYFCGGFLALFICCTLLLSSRLILQLIIDNSCNNQIYTAEFTMNSINTSNLNKLSWKPSMSYNFVMYDTQNNSFTLTKSCDKKIKLALVVETEMKNGTTQSCSLCFKYSSGIQRCKTMLFKTGAESFRLEDQLMSFKDFSFIIQRLETSHDYLKIKSCSLMISCF